MGITAHTATGQSKIYLDPPKLIKDPELTREYAPENPAPVWSEPRRISDGGQSWQVRGAATVPPAARRKENCRGVPAEAHNQRRRKITSNIII